MVAATAAEKIKHILTFPGETKEAPITTAVEQLLQASQEYGVAVKMQRVDEKTMEVHVGDETLSFTPAESQRLTRYFRPMLANIGVRASETSQAVISLYGGEGEFQFGPDPRKGFTLSFNNDMRKSFRLELTPGDVTQVKERAAAEDTGKSSFSL